MEAPDKFLRVVEEEEPLSASDVKVTLDDSYKGDWALTTAIPADALATAAATIAPIVEANPIP